MVWAPTCLQQSISECEYHPSLFLDHQYLLVKFEIIVLVVVPDLYYTKGGVVEERVCFVWKTPRKTINILKN